jgi:hypothetical protein
MAAAAGTASPTSATTTTPAIHGRVIDVIVLAVLSAAV